MPIHSRFFMCSSNKRMIAPSSLCGAIVSVLFNYLTHIYLDKMENLSCECEIDSRGKVLKALIPLFIFFSCIRLVLGAVPGVVKACFFVVIMVFDLTMFGYLTQLRSARCGCAEAARRYPVTDILYFSYFVSALVVFANIAMFALLMTTSTILSPPGFGA